MGTPMRAVPAIAPTAPSAAPVTKHPPTAPGRASTPKLTAPPPMPPTKPPARQPIPAPAAVPISAPAPVPKVTASPNFSTASPVSPGAVTEAGGAAAAVAAVLAMVAAASTPAATKCRILILSLPLTYFSLTAISERKSNSASALTCENKQRPRSRPHRRGRGRSLWRLLGGWDEGLVDGGEVLDCGGDGYWGGDQDHAGYGA